MTAAYIASLGKLWPADGRSERHPRNVRRAASRYSMKSTGDSMSPFKGPTAALDGTVSASSTLTVIFVFDSRSQRLELHKYINNATHILPVYIN